MKKCKVSFVTSISLSAVALLPSLQLWTMTTGHPTLLIRHNAMVSNFCWPQLCWVVFQTTLTHVHIDLRIIGWWLVKSVRNKIIFIEIHIGMLYYQLLHNNPIFASSKSFIFSLSLPNKNWNVGKRANTNLTSVL